MLKAELPPEVNILTIEPVIQEKDTLTVLFRVEHIYDRDEHSKFSKPVSIPIDVSSIEHERHIPIAKKKLFFQENFPSSSVARSERSDTRWKYVQK